MYDSKLNKFIEKSKVMSKFLWIMIMRFNRFQKKDEKEEIAKILILPTLVYSRTETCHEGNKVKFNLN